MKDVGEADVILVTKIKRENKEIVITQSHYIEKILKKFNREDCSPVSTPMDPIEKLKPNTGKHVDQLEYSRAIGCLMQSYEQDKAKALCEKIDKLLDDLFALIGVVDESDWTTYLVSEFDFVMEIDDDSSAYLTI
nr:zinc finger, CCHC-type [Tanacetum cinerariifolium]